MFAKLFRVDRSCLLTDINPPSSIDSSGQTILCLDQLFLLDVGFVGFEVVYKFQIFLD